MEGRGRAPKHRNTTKLPDGTELGRFWSDCKVKRRCGRPPYDRLLVNPVLRADYRSNTAWYERTIAKAKRSVAPETKVQTVRYKQPLLG